MATIRERALEAALKTLVAFGDCASQAAWDSAKAALAMPAHVAPDVNADLLAAAREALRSLDYAGQALQAPAGCTFLENTEALRAAIARADAKKG